MSTNRSSQRAAFTLVELLVVIVIIALLAGLLYPAIGVVRMKVLKGRLAVDLTDVAQAVDAYKTNRGDYFPDHADIALVKRHIVKVWPNIDDAELAGALNAFTSYGVDPAEALAFWTGGFSSDAKHPFTGPGGPFVVYGGQVYANPERLPGLAEIDPDRLTWQTPVVLDAGPPQIIGQLSSDGDNDPFAVFLPPGRKEPYVYFDSRTYGGVTKPPALPTNGYYALAGGGWARPYLTSRVDPNSPYGFEWANKNTYQLVCAGLDGFYGSDAFLSDFTMYPRYPDGVNYLSPGNGDNDNITNFSEGSALEDKKP